MRCNSARQRVQSKRPLGSFTYVNPFFSAISGYSRQELLDREFKVILPQDDVVSFNEVFRRAMSGRVPEHAKGRLLQKDGGLRTIFWSNVLIYDEDEAITGTVSIGADLTEQAERKRLAMKLSAN